MAAEQGIPLGTRPDYVQTLIVGARREVLDRTGGFVVGDGKTEACAGEILTSVRARAHGLRNVQVALGMLAWTQPFFRTDMMRQPIRVPRTVPAVCA